MMREMNALRRCRTPLAPRLRRCVLSFLQLNQIGEVRATLAPAFPGEPHVLSPDFPGHRWPLQLQTHGVLRLCRAVRGDRGAGRSESRRFVGGAASDRD